MKYQEQRRATGRTRDDERPEDDGGGGGCGGASGACLGLTPAAAAGCGGRGGGATPVRVFQQRCGRPFCERGCCGLPG